MTAIATSIQVGTRKLQLGTAVLALAAAATIAPVTGPVIAHAAPLLTAATPVLTWGSDELPTAAVTPTTIILPTPAPGNNKAVAPAAAVPGANATASASASATPAELLQELVQGIATGIQDIARGAVVIVGTTAYVAIAFTGGVITAVGDFLPGPVGQVLVNVGGAVNNVANVVAEALRVGPYATSTA